MHNEKSLCGTKSYYGYFIIKSNLLLSKKKIEENREGGYEFVRSEKKTSMAYFFEKLSPQLSSKTKR